MNVDVVQLGQVLFAVLAFVAAISAVGLLNRYLKRRIDKQPPEDRDSRLDRIEQAVDAIAIEVERISEAQRFAAKLLNERQPSGAPAPAPLTKRGHATPV